jgi:hypothetical protein
LFLDGIDSIVNDDELFGIVGRWFRFVVAFAELGIVVVVVYA